MNDYNSLKDKLLSISIIFPTILFLLSLYSFSISENTTGLFLLVVSIFTTVSIIDSIYEFNFEKYFTVLDQLYFYYAKER